MTVRTVQRMMWKHTNSGSIPIFGEGRISNTQYLTQEDVVWLNNMFQNDLQFWLEEWNGSEWVDPDDER